jgi:hypothetical protein
MTRALFIERLLATGVRVRVRGVEHIDHGEDRGADDHPADDPGEN